jgi:hypothetical protein
MEEITGTLVTGHLWKTISKYRRIYACHQTVQGFDDFSTEAIIYAKLEWSEYLRDTYSEEDRVRYLYEKCFEYDSPNTRIPIVNVKKDDQYGIILGITQHPKVLVEERDELPF